MRPAVTRRLRQAAHPPLLFLLGAGIALRLTTAVAGSAPIADYYTGDQGRFARVAYPGLFEDEWQPAGYAAWLALVRLVTNEIAVTLLLQHLLGLLTALLLYGAARAVGASRPVAMIPAAFVLLSGDQLFLERTLLAESVWTFLLAASFYLAARSIDSSDLRWVIAASAVIGISAVVRNVSLLLPVILGLWVLTTSERPWRRRVVGVTAALAPAGAVVLLYATLASALGAHSGLGEMNGWSLYGRTAQFADCRAFEPPKGTRYLCERRPTGRRPGSFYYVWVDGSPARSTPPGITVDTAGRAGIFARRAMLNQPADYFRTVSKDFLRYFDPALGYDRQFAGSSLADMSFRTTSPDPASTMAFAKGLRTKYDGVDPRPSGVTVLLESYQQVFRLNGLVLLFLLVASSLALWRAPRSERRLSALCVGTALLLLALPAAVWSFDGRYAIPPGLLLTLPAALGLATFGRRITPSD